MSRLSRVYMARYRRLGEQMATPNREFETAVRHAWASIRTAETEARTEAGTEAPATAPHADPDTLAGWGDLRRQAECSVKDARAALEAAQTRLNEAVAQRNAFYDRFKEWLDVKTGAGDPETRA